jgi:uncharacterized membrane protein YvbJ
MFCSGCGHNLTGTTGAFCPNCGRQTIAQAQTVQTASVAPKKTMIIVILIAVLAIVVVGGFFVFRTPAASGTGGFPAFNVPVEKDKLKPREGAAICRPLSMLPMPV